MSKYQVDEILMDEYLKKWNKRRLIVYVLVISVILTLTLSITYQNSNSSTFLMYLLLMSVIIVVAFYFSLKYANSQIRQLTGGQYFIDDSLIRVQGTEKSDREFNLNEIAVIHKKYSGTIIIKGNIWTKINYLRPKKSFYQVNHYNVIFIPTITTNYIELVDRVKKSAANAMKF